MINSNWQMHSDSESSASSCTSHLLPAPSSFHKRKAGRKKFRETRHPFYRGVRERNAGRWVCEVREPQKKSRIWVGTFATPEMAARAYDVAALALRGTSTALNFADSARALPRAKSSSAADIQSAAVAAAEAFGPESSSVELSLVKNQETSCVEKPPANSLVFLDEEAMFNMPSFLSNMAEAMLITPPAMANGFNWDDMDHIMDLSLWTF